MKTFTLGLLVAAAITFLASDPITAAVKSSALFGNNMVLQEKFQTPVCGTAAPSESVTVSLAGQTQSILADANGRWQV